MNVWDSVQRTLARCCNVQFAAHACHVSEEPIEPRGGVHHIAVAGGKGRMVVLHETTLAPVFFDKWAATDITAIKFSPHGRLLAAGGHDTTVEVRRS